MKKIKYFILIGLVSLGLAGCTNKKIEVEQEESIEKEETLVEENKDKEDKQEKEDKQDMDEEESNIKDKTEEKEEVKEEKIFTITTEYFVDGEEKPNPNDYNDFYTDRNGTNEYTFLNANFDLDKLELIGLDYKDDNLVETEVIKEFQLKKDDKILLNLVYPEGIPMCKLRWEVDGETEEYIFSYDGRDGNEGVAQYKY